MKIGLTKSFQDVEKLVLCFFENLYKRISGDRFIPIFNDWPCITPNQNVALVSQFSVEEIFKALKAFGSNKAPGLDGFTA